jgi:hypothetical protein
MSNEYPNDVPHPLLEKQEQAKPQIRKGKKL